MDWNDSEPFTYIKLKIKNSIFDAMEDTNSDTLFGFESVDWLSCGMYDFNLWDKLPFKKCCFTAELEDGKVHNLAVIISEDLGSPNDVRLDRFYKTLAVMRIHDDGTSLIDGLVLHKGAFYSVYNVFDEPTIDIVLIILQACLLSIHSGCEAKLCRITDKQKRINERRIKDGKKPVYEEQTIKIKPSIYYKPTGQHRNYTPPCAHQRRGHFRTYPSDKRGWVKDCKVSQGSERSIKSDYVFEYDVV